MSAAPPPARVLVVTGTDTEVGKTVVTAALASILLGRGLRVAVVKPAQTGIVPGEDGDLAHVARLSGASDLHELARFPDPLAPQAAAARAAVTPPTVADVAAHVGALAGDGRRDVVLVEGAGGLLVGLDADGATLADLAVALGAPVLVVARAGLGTLNHTALTCEALRARGLSCAGVVIGSWPAVPDLAAEENLAALAGYAQAPLLGRIPAGAGDFTPEAFADGAPTWIDTEALTP